MYGLREITAMNAKPKPSPKKRPMGIKTWLYRKFAPKVHLIPVK